MPKDYEEYSDGAVYWARIRLEQREEGVLFTSPVDGATHLVEGITIKTMKGKWWEGDYYVEILDAISEMGGCRWVLGNTTEYDYYEEEDNYYLEVMENGRLKEEVNA